MVVVAVVARPGSVQARSESVFGEAWARVMGGCIAPGSRICRLVAGSIGAARCIAVVVAEVGIGSVSCIAGAGRCIALA